MTQLASETAVRMRWLGAEPSLPAGVTWGVPWREGKLRRDEPLRLEAADGGGAYPLQSWPTAYWPDGSVKWSAHAASGLPGDPAGFRLRKGQSPEPERRVTVTETEETIAVDTGAIVCTLGKTGTEWVRSVTRGRETVCGGGRLVCLKADRSEVSGTTTIREEAFESRIRQAIVEQAGPIRAVVRLDGRHLSAAGSREWLPFTLRVYAYAGVDAIRLVHTFVYDGNPHEDEIRGLGLRFSVPMRGPLYNRHVRFAGDRGWFAESPKTLHTRRTKDKYRELFERQTHGESSYEGAEELRATPYGVANTSELMLWCTGETPEPRRLNAMLRECRSPTLLVCEPEHYRAAGAFGIWSLLDRSHPVKARLEERLDGIVAFYRKEIERRRWYGFWDYGDVMHSYDPVRHVWNYDLGGCAWQNTELAPNMWLWVTFLRSGREEAFRLAEAMTRHTSEVDVYHIGEYAGLGSRHNVVHWGCGCKEARIAMAGLHRYYYYLTADERVGDIMDEVRDADFATVRLDPMRAYFPPDEHPTHIRVGPDWAAFSSNWMTRWERYEDAAYRDKIATGIACIKRANFRLISGPTYGYDPQTGVLTPLGDDNWGRHLAICMGGPQVWFELAGMLKDPEWEDMLSEFGVYYNQTQEEKDRLTHGRVSAKHFEHPVLSAGIAAYGAYRRQDPDTARRVWSILLANPYARTDLEKEAAEALHVDTVPEIDWINTNEAAQWSLNAIIALELIPEALPEMGGGTPYE